MSKAKPKTIHNDLVTFKQLTNFAVSRDMISINPLAGLELPKPKNTPQPYWTRPQVEDIVAATSPRYQGLFHFLADTGTRISEACWLTWDDVDLVNHVVHVRPKQGWKPKSGDQRTIPLSPAMYHMLNVLPRTANWVFPAPPTARFPSTQRQVSPRRALAHLKVVLKKVGLPGHLHTFRHSFISYALTSGVAPAIVREWVGHVDEDIMKLYTHIADQQSRSAMDKMLPDNVHHGGDADDNGS